MNTQKKSFGLTVATVLMGVLIIILIFLLMRRDNVQTEKSDGIISPMISNQDKSGDGAFSDGLINPESSHQGRLDQYGAGVAQTDVFSIDINDDGVPDKITRVRHENGTDHFYFEYQIQVNIDGQMVNVIDENLRTTESAECALQKIKFQFKPTFQVIKISRPWVNSWTTPSMATKTTYNFVNGKLVPTNVSEMKVICDVAQLI